METDGAMGKIVIVVDQESTVLKITIPALNKILHPIGFANRPAPILAASEPATGCR